VFREWELSHNKQLISIIIATHNRPQLLTRTLDSVARQTYRPLEVVIVDDGSGNATRQAVHDWGRRARPGFRLSYQWQENQGPATARNRGVEASSGERVQFLDDDDLLCPGALEYLARALAGERSAIAMASYQHWERGNPVGAAIRPRCMEPDEMLRSMIQGSWFVPIHGYLFTRSALEQIGPWNPVLTSQEDDEFLLRAAIAGIPLRPASDARVYYCRHDGARRATPGKPGETVDQGLEKRMFADLAIRESVFETLGQRQDMEQYRIAFSLWQMRLRKRYSTALSRLNPQSELLEWLGSSAEEAASGSSPPLASM